jgi:hypothetical protein
MLVNALDYGINEADFWQMTFAELERQVESKKRVQKLEAQEKATVSYIHSIIQARFIAGAFSNGAEVPDISEFYPTLFDDKESKEKKQESKDELSALRFKMFAASYNKKFEEVASD